ncbi:hypothetical protein [uncultured Streptococcus sp.]|uniref:hypothetical protein n=1 Tax=uncultured Streptococcus sp. TaxID=83427 RepID=UPI00265D8C21|nr:hypothetical protein [uncultured Streptococcus sp.]
MSRKTRYETDKKFLEIFEASFDFLKVVYYGLERSKNVLRKYEFKYEKKEDKLNFNKVIFKEGSICLGNLLEF